MQVHIATSREIGQRCIQWAKERGYTLVSMEDCEVFISVMYDKLIDEAFINSKRACYNFHPGVLPQYRGSGSYSWAIINGDSHAGVTIHKIDLDIDRGDILEVRKFTIGPVDTAEDLFKLAEDQIFVAFQFWFPLMVDKTLEGSSQDESKAKLYYRKQLHMQKDLTRFIRAFTFEGKESAYYYNKKGEKIYLNYE